jgi:UDP-glucose 4-epimerase
VTRTFLITGGAGFVGSALAAQLAARGERVRILDDLSMGSRAYLDGVDHELIAARIDDPVALGSALTGVTDVVHLAARAGIPDSIADPMGTFTANVRDSVQLLDAARLAGVDRFVFASSNAVLGYANPPFDETLLPAPTSPYGASKLAGEAYVGAYAATYGLVACSLRFSNVFGPRSLHKKSVVAAWLRSALDGGPLTVFGDGTQTRDFVYVEDLVAGVRAALDAPREAVSGEVFQVGTGRETTVLELAKVVRSAAGRGEIRFAPRRAGDPERNFARVDRARERLGFEAPTSLTDGIAATVAWFRAALDDPALAAIEPLATSGSD